MNQNQIAKQMIQFNKTAFDNNFNAIKMVCAQNEKMAQTFLAQANWIPEEGKKAFTDGLDAYRTGCESFKKLVDDNYAKVEDYFNKE
jgi:hypothetical protein